MFNSVKFYGKSYANINVLEKIIPISIKVIGWNLFELIIIIINQYILFGKFIKRREITLLDIVKGNIFGHSIKVLGMFFIIWKHK